MTRLQKKARSRPAPEDDILPEYSLRGSKPSPYAARIGHASSGNVFIDAGFPHGQATCLLIRSELLSQVTHAIKAEGLTRRQAAKALDVTQTRIGDLFRGRLDLFSIDALVEMLSRFGVSVTLKTRRRLMQEIKSKRGFLRGINTKVPREDDRT